MKRANTSESARTGRLTRRDFMKTAAVTGLAMTGTARFTKAASKSDMPNIVLLFSDQHQADCLGFQDHPDVLTPNLDKLAKRGTVFNRAYCQDGVCVPSRMALMTGIYPRRLGCLHNPDVSSVMDEVVSLPSMLKKNGYYTAAFGKRHLKGAADKGWDYHRGHSKDETPGNSYWEWIEEQGYLDEFLHDWAAEFNGKYPIADLATRISRLPEDKTMEAFTAKETIKLIREQKDRDEPFFCWASFYRPHQPYNAQKRFLDEYDYSRWGKGTAEGDAIQKPPTLDQEPDALPPALEDWHEGKNRVWRLDKAAEDEQLYRFYIASYYALVTEIDHHVGAIMDALEEEGLLENTIVIYTSDHGDFAGRHGMVEKCAIGHNFYEETLRVPLIVSYPKNVKRQQVDDLVEMFDLYPTILELAGIDLPETKHGIDATSLGATLTGGQSEKRDYIVSENWSQATVITEDHKLGIWLDPTEYAKSWDFRSFGDMLVDRGDDPHEMHNQIENPKYAQISKQLRKYYADFTSRIPATGKSEIVRRAKPKVAN
ncbi:Arylsulfatase [Anaerohalosphaera lusitana]|uniref:Arylsulfatase n=1 Tax=Anaerohalosphaera lusitana TaxID=1936003 RepID=A0A1U9NQ24_9BACT|nr:sulfatase-like hydrolase/transferase [Anaerohalosphaera lusitana]AQT69818.1 Arylsulfatase [Anaerohalosphaera lusitana]